MKKFALNNIGKNVGSEMQIEYPYDDQSPTPCCTAYLLRDDKRGDRHSGMPFAPRRAHIRSRWLKIDPIYGDLFASKARLHTGKKVRRAADKKRHKRLVGTARLSHPTGSEQTETENHIGLIGHDIGVHNFGGILECA
ncbi:hypothetical protein [Maritalea sp. S77]|uniref:hypothetical protein n=1 Tax=Maritalea sp. S77 TaxID=3415125 RepID=UPI003C7C3A77